MRLSTPFDIERYLARKEAEIGSVQRQIALRQLAPMFGWHQIASPGQPGWATHDTIYGPPGMTVPVFPDPPNQGAQVGHRWSSIFDFFTDSFHRPGFSIDTQGFVHLRGMGWWTVLDSGPNLMFVLPEGFRPPGGVLFSTVVSYREDEGFTNQFTAQITIGSDGAVSLETAGDWGGSKVGPPVFHGVTDSGSPNFTPLTGYWTYWEITIPFDGLSFPTR